MSKGYDAFSEQVLGVTSNKSSLRKYINKNIRFRRLQKRNVFELVKPKKGDTVLDVGCGTGKFVAYFSNICNVAGVDINPEQLLYANDFALTHGQKKNFGFLCNKGKKLNSLFYKNSFDKVMLIDVVEHMPDEALLGLFSEIREVLKDDGKVYVYTPNRSHVFERFRNNEGHINLMVMRDLKDLLRCGGFSIVKAYYGYSHIRLFNFFERVIPLNCFKRRLCVVARKEAKNGKKTD